MGDYNLNENLQVFVRNKETGEIVFEGESVAMKTYCQTKKNKVIVSKEVAETIKYALNEYTPNDLLQAHDNFWADELKPLNELDHITLADALVNGYEVVLSPEEKVIEYFKSNCEIVRFYNAQKKETLDRCEIEQERFSSGFVTGMWELAKAYKIDRITDCIDRYESWMGLTKD